MKLRFSVLAESYGIYQLAENASIPNPTMAGLWSFMRAENESTVVCALGGCPHALHKNEGWTAIKLHGPFDFALTGILAEVARILATAHIGIFALSTFDTDYILVKTIHINETTQALSNAGHVFVKA